MTRELIRRDRTNLPPARFLSRLSTTESPLLPSLNPGPYHPPGAKGSLGHNAKCAPRPSTTGGNTADRAVHRASQKGYTAGRIPVDERRRRTPATVDGWCDGVRGKASHCVSFIIVHIFSIPTYCPPRRSTGGATEYAARSRLTLPPRCGF